MNVTYNYSGKKVLITGGASGIGLAAARAYADSGADVAVFDKKFEIETKEGRLWQIPVDLTDSSQIDAAFAKLEREWGALDVLVNNAGIELVAGLEDMAEASWDLVFDTNIKSVYLCSKAAMPWLKASKGNIVNTASQLAVVGAGSFTAYTAAKAAVVNFSRSLALETASSGVRVNAICPGAIDTPLLRRQFAGGQRGPQGTIEDLIAMHPLGRLGDAKEIANCILFLSSDAASFVTGSAMFADGGYTSF
jgi:NAD(P)-dependent dehydrogenase (short-subunit alcohol dehydrogenase family)